MTHDLMREALAGLIKAVNYRDACSVSRTSAPRVADAAIRLQSAIDKANEALSASAPKGDTSPPPAAGWDEATAHRVDWWLKEISDCNEKMWNGSRVSHFGQIAKGVEAIRESLRRAATAPEGVADDVNVSALADLVEDAIASAGMTLSLSRPAAGGGVRDQIAALAHRFWSIHPSSLDDMGLTREQFYAREMTALITALSTPSDAVNESAEARLREALDSSQWLLALVRDVGPNGDDWRSERLSQLLIQQIVDNREALSAGGDEAKKSEGGPGSNCSDPSRSNCDPERSPSDPPDRREIKLTEVEWRNVDALRKHWGAFCDADPFDGSDTFSERMESAGFIELVPVDDDELDDAFASERGIEPGGMMWALTDAGLAALDGLR